MNVLERDLFKALRSRYPVPAWGLFAQVPNETGGLAGSYADAVAVALWPSLRGQVHGFEFKSSRADWLRELRQEGKAEAVARYCNFWWLVTPTLQIARPDELPQDWGWLCWERQRRLPAQRKLERQVNRDQLVFGDLLETVDAHAGAVFTTLQPPAAVMLQPRRLQPRSNVLWTAVRAGLRQAAPPDWLFVAAVLRRAEADLYGQRTAGRTEVL